MSSPSSSDGSQTDPGAVANFPQQVSITAYGNGGFRFAEMSHRGSLLCLPNAMTAWDATAADQLTPESFAAVFSQSDRCNFLLFGTGDTLIVPSDAIYKAFEVAGIGLELMSTGAAARTYNVLLAEDRPVAAALIAVA